MFSLLGCESRFIFFFAPVQIANVEIELLKIIEKLLEITFLCNKSDMIASSEAGSLSSFYYIPYSFRSMARR